MTIVRILVRLALPGMLLVCAHLGMPETAAAQTTGIAGAVRDTSGAVLPGVTVEASSPALIEKTRSAVTDERGLYSIIALRPGTYTVTFTLPGFQNFRREGIELTGSFTATVNAELRVSGVEETVTVTGQSPVVDIRNVIQQRVLTDQQREALPTGRSVQMMAQTIPGITQNPVSRPSGQDVGGLSGERGVLLIHGSKASDFALQVDGTPLTIGAFAGNQTVNLNPTEAQEFVYETGAIAAETMTGGVRVNVVPKEGGNRYSGQFMGAYVPDAFQSNNLTDELKTQGLQSANNLLKSWDYNYAAGGPIKRDRLWFFASYRDWGLKETISGMFRMVDPLSFVFDPRLGAAGNADLSRPAEVKSWQHTGGARLTWQINNKNKVSFYGMNSPRLWNGAEMSGTRAYEASVTQKVTRNFFLHGVWKAPVTTRLLLQAAVARMDSQIAYDEMPGVVPGTIAVTDSGTGISYRARSNYFLNNYPDNHVNVSVAYVTGSHAAKFGVQFAKGYLEQRNFREPGAMSYSLRNGVPTAITVYNAPRNPWYDHRNLGIYLQDQWTLRRLTVNAGLRFDYHNQGVLDKQTSGPNQFAPLQHWPAFDDVANWKDVSPRLGVSYDLFGTGKTALKGSLSRYVAATSVSSLAFTINPMELNASATRTWNDVNRDFIPQESELGPLSNRNFGTTQTSIRLDEAFTQGWGHRFNNWEGSLGVQHEVLPGVGLSASYIHRWYGNFDVLDNLLVTPSDNDEFCITAPTDTRLGDVSGSRICGLYDLNPSKLGQVLNFRTGAESYGERKETFDGIDVTLNARFPHNMTIAGGLSSGTSTNLSVNSSEACFAVDSPVTAARAFTTGAWRFCDVNMPWKTAVRFLGTVGLPGGVDLGATFQSNPGPELRANYTVTNAQVQGLGRNLVSGSATLELIEPGSLYGDRVYQIDLRVSKRLRYRALRVRLNLDLANALNSSAILVYNQTYGSNWLRPTYIMPGRVIKPSVQIDF